MKLKMTLGELIKKRWSKKDLKPLQTTDEVIKNLKDKYGMEVTEKELEEYANMDLLDGIEVTFNEAK